MTNLILEREARRPIVKPMIKSYPSMDNDQEFIEALFSALEERDRQIRQLLRLLQEKRLIVGDWLSFWLSFRWRS